MLTIVFYCIVLYCIILYLYIYIARLAVHTNQKRFQCKRPREKRAVHNKNTLDSVHCSVLSNDISRPLKSFITVSIQFFRGLPLLFLPSGAQCNIWLALLSMSMRHTWPSHRSFSA